MCNCTSYVAWALEAHGLRTDWFVPGEMDARNWPEIAREHEIDVGTTPRAGAVAVWPHLTRFGHVAYVTRVDPDGRFDVAEYNLPTGRVETFVFDRRRGLSRSGVTFIYVPRRD
jgi:surface antigen